MRWTEHDFAVEAGKCIERYRRLDFWHNWPKDDTDTIQKAWRLYTRANENALKKLLLGDAKIRSGDLLTNFGLTRGNDEADKQEQQKIAEIDALRTRHVGPRSGPAVPTLGPGSILSDQHWSPMMNDAFILGGVHGEQDFHWAEDGFQAEHIAEKTYFDNRAVFGQATPAAAGWRDASYYKEQLRRYLISRNNFWSGGVIRIFARELIGLKNFGYQFKISSHTLSFAPRSDRPATFQVYLDALVSSGYYEASKSPAAVNGTIAEFLFGDRSALTGLSTGIQTVTPTNLKASPKKPAGWPN